MLKEKSIFYIIAVFAIILGLLTDYLFYQKPIGVSFFIFTSLVAAFSIIAAKNFEQKPNKVQIFILASAILLSAAVFLRASSFLTFFNVIGTIYLIFLFFALFADRNILNFRFLKYIAAPLIFIARSLAKAAKPINGYVRTLSGDKEIGSKEFRSVLRGIIIALPILIILGSLLYSADSVFRAYLNRFIQINVDIDLILLVRILKVIVISYIFIGIFYKFSDTEKTDNPALAQRSRPLGSIESTTIMILVESLFLAFIAIQFFYLFGGKNYVWGLNEYVTYAEYAKSGFYELIQVSIVSFILIYALDGFGKKETPKEKKTFKLLSAILVFEIIVILFSAFKRLLLYVDGYGLTLQRFLVFSFMIWIFLIFLAFLNKIFREYKNTVFIFSVFALTLAVWLGINVVNPDKLIAKVNIQRFIEGKKLDPYYFSSLSEDAVPSIMEIFKLNIDEETKERIATDLDWRYFSGGIRCARIDYNYLISEPYAYSECMTDSFGEKLKKFEEEKPWQSFNLSEASALAAIKENIAQIEKYQLQYRQRQAAACKDVAAKCEAGCVTNTLQPLEVCKSFCNPEGCDKI